MGNSSAFRYMAKATRSGVAEQRELAQCGSITCSIAFWQARDQTKLCGSRNYYHMHRRTDAAGSVSPDGMSEFWVMRVRKSRQQAVAPADAAIIKDVGQHIVTLICSEGSALDCAFEDADLMVEG